MRKSVILQVLPMLKRGGVEAFVMNNFRSIDRERFQFIFLIIGEGEEYDDEISSLGGKVIHSGLCFSHACKLIPNFIALIKLLKDIEFDAIHSHINQFNGLIFLAAIIAGKVISACSISGSPACRFLSPLITKMNISIDIALTIAVAPRPSAITPFTILSIFSSPVA